MVYGQIYLLLNFFNKTDFFVKISMDYIHSEGSDGMIVEGSIACYSGSVHTHASILF